MQFSGAHAAGQAGLCAMSQHFVPPENRQYLLRLRGHVGMGAAVGKSQEMEGQSDGAAVNV